MRLYINIDHVATIRQARLTNEPDPVRAAVLAELGGADGITVHLRVDRRHILDRDLRLLAETVRTGINLEIAAEPDMMAIALELSPMAVTLVPERAEEVTTEGGLGLGSAEQRKKIGGAIGTLHDAGIRTALFMDPTSEGLRAAAELGPDAVELHTGEYAVAWGRRYPGRAAAQELADELQRLRRAAALGHSLGLDIHAGHGLTYENVTPVAAITEIEELNIGHSVVSRAVLIGLERAVREMKEIVREARTSHNADRLPG
jgi:pyridoxine 5-phosphate synthase